MGTAQAVEGCPKAHAQVRIEAFDAYVVITRGFIHGMAKYWVPEGTGTGNGGWKRGDLRLPIGERKCADGHRDGGPNGEGDRCPPTRSSPLVAGNKEENPSNIGGKKLKQVVGDPDKTF